MTMKTSGHRKWTGDNEENGRGRQSLQGGKRLFLHR